jgi:hypothetical protein
MTKLGFALTAGSALMLAASVAGAQDRIPPGQMPPNGMCRVWVNGVPPGRQPRATDCATARRTAPANSRILYGGSSQGAVTYDPRYGRTNGSVVDPRYDPRSSVYDPRYDSRSSVYDPRYDSRSTTYDPRYDSRSSVYDPRLDSRNRAYDSRYSAEYRARIEQARARAERERKHDNKDDRKRDHDHDHDHR